MKNHLHLGKTIGRLFFLETETSTEKRATAAFEANFVGCCSLKIILVVVDDNALYGCKRRVGYRGA
jgi:hypothetical protein